MRTHRRRSLEIVTNRIRNHRLKIFNSGKAQLFPGFYIVRRLREIRIPVMFPNRLTVFRPGFSTGKSRYILAAASLFAKETSNLEICPRKIIFRDSRLSLRQIPVCFPAPLASSSSVFQEDFAALVFPQKNPWGQIYPRVSFSPALSGSVPGCGRSRRTRNNPGFRLLRQSQAPRGRARPRRCPLRLR